MSNSTNSTSSTITRYAVEDTNKKITLSSSTIIKYVVIGLLGAMIGFYVSGSSLRQKIKTQISTQELEAKKQLSLIEEIEKTNKELISLDSIYSSNMILARDSINYLNKRLEHCSLENAKLRKRMGTITYPQVVYKKTFKDVELDSVVRQKTASLEMLLKQCSATTTKAFQEKMAATQANDSLIVLINKLKGLHEVEENDPHYVLSATLNDDLTHIEQKAHINQNLLIEVVRDKRGPFGLFKSPMRIHVKDFNPVTNLHEVNAIRYNYIQGTDKKSKKETELPVYYHNLSSK